MADAQFSGTDGATPPTATTENNPALINDASGGGTTEATMTSLAASSALPRWKHWAMRFDCLHGDGIQHRSYCRRGKRSCAEADYSVELAQDLKAIHGLDAESELANILSTEILAEINREVVRTVYRGAKSGAQANVANAGVFDLDVDSTADGRLRSSKVSCSRSSAMPTQSHKKLVAERATLSSPLLT